MPKYIIEREIQGVGKLDQDELKGISQNSRAVLEQLGPKIQWIQSFVTDDKIYCIYIAPDVEVIKTHAHVGGFPSNSILEVRSVIDLTTAE